MRLEKSENMNDSVLYSTLERKETIKCVASGYPAPKMTLLFNGIALSDTSYAVEQDATTKRQYVLSYTFVGAAHSTLVESPSSTTITSLLGVRLIDGGTDTQTHRQRHNIK